MREITHAEIVQVSGGGPTGQAAIGIAAMVGTMAVAVAAVSATGLLVGTVGIVAAGVLGLAHAYNTAEDSVVGGGSGGGGGGGYPGVELPDLNDYPLGDGCDETYTYTPVGVIVGCR